MKKIAIAMVSAVSMMMFSGCSSVFTPENSGILAGKAAYLGYQKVAEKQPQEFKEKVVELWAEVNKVESVSDLKVVSVAVNTKFNDILANKNLSDTDKKLLTSLKNDICSKIDSVLDDKLSTNADGIDFLIGVRKGVNSMIDASNQTNK